MEQQYYEIFSNFSPVLNLALALLRGRGYGNVCEIISSSKISVVNTEYDGWNGGTYGYTVYVSLSVKQYTSFSSDKIEEMEKMLSEALNESIKGNGNDYFIVQIGPSLSKEDIDWNLIGGLNSRATLKQNIDTIKKAHPTLRVMRQS